MEKDLACCGNMLDLLDDDPGELPLQCMDQPLRDCPEIGYHQYNAARLSQLRGLRSAIGMRFVVVSPVH
ncbi:hypothetical protein [Sinorhizobium medicae]|uniref:hypothetical protein n=1 Tax=Sinorhizobium medicae TaxID=110321 RepID=UPI002B1BDD25|nr:hypothetical protein [Sinorhizobium medicae]